MFDRQKEQMRIERWDSLPSTNDRAKEIFFREPEVDAVVADRQSCGRGTRERSFYSPSGGLYLSYLYRGAIPLDRLLRITPLAAVAVRRALGEFEVRVGIKWVNDLLLGGKKLCGILTEPRFVNDVCVGAVIGVGINLEKTEFPPPLDAIATAIGNEGLPIPSRESLIARILFHLERLLSGDTASDCEAMTEYRKASVLIGARVCVQGTQEAYEALVLEIDDTGRLVVLRDGASEPHSISAGVSQLQIL